MGIFDKVEKDAEEAMAQDDPRLAQQAGQLGGGQLGGGQDQDQDQDQNREQAGSDQDQNQGG